MNVFQPCRNTSDTVPLYLPQQLYLKPAACLTISIQLPNIKKLEKSISHWEIMEKLRSLISPDEFSVLKVSKTTLNLVRFEAELENRTRLERVVSKLDNNSIKLKEFPDLLRVKASEVRTEFPTRHKWDAFFQEAKDMDEMKPGQRPDTVHISNLPRKWFVPYHLAEDEDATPSEKMFYRIFEKFGQIRFVDIPVCDPYRKKMKDHISGIKAHPVDDKDFFEGYVQFKDYIGFTKTMDALKGMKLVRKEEDEAFCVNIKVDFDRSKHLSDASIRRREIVRDRLVKKQREKEEKEKNELDAKKTKELDERQKEITLKSEKEQRRREREQKRKAKLLEKLKINSCDEINDKIAKEEKKLLKAQRKLEAIRLVEELFRRIKEKKDELHMYSKTKSASGDELKRFKDMSELEVLTQRQKLHNAIEGRVVLKNILSGKKKSRSRSSSSSDTSLSLDNDRKDRNIASEVVYDPTWYNYPIYPPPIHVYPPRGRYPLPGPSRGRPFRGRGFRSRYRGGYRGKYSHYSPEMEEQYMRYFSKFFSEHDRRSRSRTRSRSRRSYSRSRSKSRHRSYSRSSSRSYTPKRTRKRSRRSKTRSKSVDSSKFVSPRSLRRRSKSWSMPRSGEKGRSWSKSP
ncbi:A-kinase anchor protein 17A [Tribolium madens]|uniref:A-kinase anchor protein 17A n=1 Tax=Tribolium madens TaxID=41895 RepID=UPI001CF73E77|nr:A-kinase anchor protein 17A [Tribolium madens]